MSRPAPSAPPILLREDRAGITTLTLNRPRQLNALSEALLGEIQTALDDIAGDESVRVIVIAAAGRAFCPGHDLKEMRARPDSDRPYYENLFRRSSRVMMTLTELPQPVIARVQGIATAAGCQLVAACDLAVASTEATFAVNGIDQGLFCSTPSVPLSRNVPRKQAFEMLFTGDFIDAETALARGLVNRVAAPAELDGAVAALAGSIRAKSRVAVATGKRLFYRQRERDLEGAYALASEVMAGNMMAEDAAEGLDAFLEKRAPAWKGR